MDTDTTAELQKSLGIDIDPETLRLALTHRSFAFEAGGIPTNERLEFLGDSVLGLVATESLYYDNPDLPEGQLAKMRSAVVNTRALAAIARRHDIGRHILLGKGEELTGGRNKDSILADTVEALIGATFVSSDGTRRSPSSTGSSTECSPTPSTSAPAWTSRPPSRRQPPTWASVP